MTSGHTSQTLRPDLPTATAWSSWGVDPAWSRLIEVGANTWHVLDTGAPVDPAAPSGVVTTIVCVHGNPTWSLLWRSFLSRFGDRYRVIAVDQLGMGFSDRPGRRRFAQRVDDLDDVLAALAIDGPVVMAAHDWGGPISLGWVLRHRAQVQGVVLCNTGVAVPAGRRAPTIIRFAAAGPITALVGHWTRTFVEGTLWLSGRRLDPAFRAGLRAPYRAARFRRAIAEFVDDVPFSPSYPSAASVAEVAEGIRSLTMPILLAWGSKDPVFNDDFALDLAHRLPHADRHRFPGLGHLVVEETDIAAVVDSWLSERVFPQVGEVVETVGAGADLAEEPVPSIWAAIADRARDDEVAFVDGTTGLRTTFAELNDRVMGVAAGLIARGVAPGDRVAVLVHPGIDLLATVYGCWRAGAITVVADRGLGLRGLRAAVRAAHVQWVVGPPKAIAAARLLRWAPRAGAFVAGPRRVPTAVATLDELVAMGAAMPAEPQPDDVAAVLYTSGATGPAKGVRYTHRQMSAQRDAVRSTYGIGPADRLVAAFAPFALYGPALGIASTIPDVDVTAPGTLTASALSVAIESIGATIVFASPAALANVNRTLAGSSASGSASSFRSLRMVLSAGAPVPIATLRATAALCPNAELHTPYGMTECLPVADIELAERESASAAAESNGGTGVCVGRAVSGVELLIAPLDFDPGSAVSGLPTGSTGEVLVRAPWLSDGYDQLWRTEYDARPQTGDGLVWHRTGDVGRIDQSGMLWIEGRNVHVIHAVDGPVTPVPIEVAVEGIEGIDRAAAVGVGPHGCQQLVVVVEDVSTDDGIADQQRCDAVRTAVASASIVPVAAVLTVSALPVDIRHNTKIDRAAVARWAADLLAGNRARRPW